MIIMKPTIYRRVRRHPASSEAATFNKENQQVQSFFGEPSHEPFFKPTNTFAPAQSIQRKCAECEKEEKKVSRKTEEDDDKILMKRREEDEDEPIQMKEKRPDEEEKVQKKDTGVTSPPVAGNFIRSLSGKGDPMTAKANAFFSDKMNYDFSNVKVHTGPDAADSAKELNAKAYTLGNNIVFNQGQYNRESNEGKKLLAHELTHIMQQNPDPVLKRKNIPEEHEKEKTAVPTFSERDVIEQNTRHFADCNGVTLEGLTDANYGNSYSAPGVTSPGRDCAECSSEDCVTNSGTVISVFTANPQVTLPPVPSGLNACEQRAVQNFINTTLNSHEQKHVAAFNTYSSTVRTPYTYRGCASGLDAYTQQIHDNIESARKTKSDKKSADLDLNGANIFTVSCECPDTEPDGKSKE
jgi:hypothetical protein